MGVVSCVCRIAQVISGAEILPSFNGRSNTRTVPIVGNFETTLLDIEENAEPRLRYHENFRPGTASRDSYNLTIRRRNQTARVAMDRKGYQSRKAL
jgi:hypothetical protein